MLITAIFNRSNSSENWSSLIVISVSFGCNVCHFAIICSSVSSSCWPIWYMLFGYVCLKLFVIFCFEQSARGRLFYPCTLGIVPVSIHLLRCSRYLSVDLFFPSSSIFFLIKECFCPLIYISFYFYPFTYDVIFWGSHLLSQLPIWFSPSLFDVGVVIRSFMLEGFLLILSCMLSLFMLLVVWVYTRPVSI